MLITQYERDWYFARYKFATKYGTIATATGYGRTHFEALADCFEDYQVIISL